MNVIELRAKLQNAVKNVDFKISTLQKQRAEIAIPLEKQIEKATAKVTHLDGKIREKEIQTNLQHALRRLTMGINTLTDYQDFAKLARISGDSERVVPHHLNPKYVVIGLRGWGERIYIAFAEGNVCSIHTCEIAGHPGDYTTNKTFGIKVKQEPSPANYRTGYTLKEWLNPEFVRWIGIDALTAIKILRGEKI
jgi:hypothetical protein